MDIYKEASRLALRFTTVRGVLAAEQLWDLPLLILAAAIKDTKKQLNKNEDSDLDFLDDTKVTDIKTELRFNILKDVYLSKKKETEDARTAAENKAHNQKILSIIQQKKEGQLQDMSVEDLEKMLK